MSVLALPPGAVLAGRYRLERPLRCIGAAVLWRGIDEALARPVAVRVAPAGDPVAHRLLDAARAAGRIGSPRLASVLDATETTGMVVVVSEWMPGTSFAELVHAGPLPPVEAATVLAGVAAALADAHRAGQAHGALTAGSVILAPTGPRVAGLGLDAALSGSEPDPAADLRALGALLFAALTGRAPSRIGGEPRVPDPLPGLPAAPVVAGRGCTARQVRAGVPADLDALAERAMGHAGALPSAEELAATLGAVVDAADLRRSRSLARRLVPAAIVVAVAAWVAGQAIGRLPTSPGRPALPIAGSPPPPSPSAPPSFTPVDVRDFDPYGDGAESPGAVRLAHDGDPATAWTTSVYRARPDLGGLKPGVGLLVDLGVRRSVRAVDVVVRGGPTDMELRAADTAGDRADAFDVVASAAKAAGAVTLRPSRPQARYWLVWLTRLPTVAAGYRGEVAEITFRP